MHASYRQENNSYNIPRTEEGNLENMIEKEQVCRELMEREGESSLRALLLAINAGMQLTCYTDM